MKITEKNIDQIPYDKIIDYLAKESNMFVLTTPFEIYQEEYDPSVDFSGYHIPSKDQERLIDESYKHKNEQSKRFWDQISDEEKKILPSFEYFIKEVEQRGASILENTSNEEMFIENNQCDNQYVSSMPNQLWHIFSCDDFYRDILFLLRKSKKNTKKRDLELILRNEENKVLLDNLVSSELSFSWELTSSSQLHIIYYFKINEDTVNWLKSKKSFFNYTDELDDLSFHNDSKCIFAVCNHENFLWVEPFESSELNHTIKRNYHRILNKRNSGKVNDEYYILASDEDFDADILYPDYAIYELEEGKEKPLDKNYVYEMYTCREIGYTKENSTSNKLKPKYIINEDGALQSYIDGNARYDFDNIIKYIKTQLQKVSSISLIRQLNTLDTDKKEKFNTIKEKEVIKLKSIKEYYYDMMHYEFPENKKFSFEYNIEYIFVLDK